MIDMTRLPLKMSFVFLLFVGCGPTLHQLIESNKDMEQKLLELDDDFGVKQIELRNMERRVKSAEKEAEWVIELSRHHINTGLVAAVSEQERSANDLETAVNENDLLKQKAEKLAAQKNKLELRIKSSKNELSGK